MGRLRVALVLVLLGAAPAVAKPLSVPSPPVGPPLEAPPVASVGVKDVVIGLATFGGRVGFLTGVNEPGAGYWRCGSAGFWSGRGVDAPVSLAAACANGNVGDSWDFFTFAAAPGLLAWANCGVTMHVQCRLD